MSEIEQTRIFFRTYVEKSIDAFNRRLFVVEKQTSTYLEILEREIAAAQKEKETFHQICVHLRDMELLWTAQIKELQERLFLIETNQVK
jgi:hypothetical protein